jgi:hypothetical protein
VRVGRKAPLLLEAINALSSGLPLNVDLDATLTVIAGNLYRLLARRLPRYERATPDKLWRHFLDATGTIHTPDALTIDLNLRTYPPRPDPSRPRRHPNPNSESLAQRPRATVPLPTPMTPQHDYLTEDRG